MSKDGFLHHHLEFKEVIESLSDEQDIDETLAEKDYWIMHCLHGLQQCGYEFKMKGGTSLFKGFGLIHRFSEDIDLQITPPDELALKTGRNHDRPNHIQGRIDFYDSLAEGIVIDGIQTTRDTEFDDLPKYRNGGIRLIYEQQFASNASATKDGVLLEVGFAKVEPNTPIDISSWVYDHAESLGLDMIDNRAKGVLCYDVGYNFVEKLSALSSKYRNFQEGKLQPRNFVRHFYDVHCLLKDERVRNFAETEEFESYRKECFRKLDYEIPLSKNPAYLLADADEFEFIKKEYEGMRRMYYRGQPDFAEVMDTIRNWVANC